MSDADVSRATNEFLAEELRADARATEQAAEVQAALNPSPTPSVGPPAAAAPGAAGAESLAAAVKPEHLKKLATALLGVCDRIIVGQAGKEFALTPEEKSEIADAAVPVMAKYLPQALGWLVTTPEGVLLGTVGIVYAGKLGVDVMGLADTQDATPPPGAANAEAKPEAKA